jgi:hypothetical protein
MVVSYHIGVIKLSHYGHLTQAGSSASIIETDLLHSAVQIVDGVETLRYSAKATTTKNFVVLKELIEVAIKNAYSIGTGKTVSEILSAI